MPEKKLTKEIIDSVGYPLIEIRTNDIIKRQLLLPISYRENFINFFSGSGQSLTIHSFLISKTNGFNTYLSSVEASTNSPLIKQTPTNLWPNKDNRTYGFITAQNKIESISFECFFSNLGIDKIEIISKNYKLHKIKESCFSKNTKFDNFYWADNSGYIWKSKQWISFKNIFAEVLILKKY